MNRRYKRTTVVVTFAVAVLGASVARAQQDQQQSPASEATWQQKYEELEKKLNALEDKLDTKVQTDDAKAQEQAAKEKEAPVIRAGQNGFILQSADTNFWLRVGGYGQFDARFYLHDKPNNGIDTFVPRRVRPILEGAVYQDFYFRLMPDFGNGASSSTILQDAYVEWQHWSWLKPRVGKYKPPVGLEQLQQDQWLVFAERGLPSDLVPQRDVGVQFSGDLFDGTVSYAAGVFNGVVDNSIGDVGAWDSKDGAARLFLQPFKNSDIAALKGFGFGAGGSIGFRDFSGTTTNLPAYKTTGQLTFFSFDKGVILDGQQLRGTPQAYYYWGPLGVLGEYTVSDETARRGAVRDDLRNNAWQTEASFVLTGEDASYNGVTPRRVFKLGTGGWGAVEVAGRYGELHLDPNAFSKTPSGAGLRFADPTKNAQEAREWGVGLNWYLNRNVKLVLDYEETSFDGGAGSETSSTFSTRNRATEQVVISRAQIVF